MCCIKTATIGKGACFLILLLLIAGHAMAASTPEGTTPEKAPTLLTTLGPEFDFRYVFKTLGSYEILDPSESTQNPDNDFLRVPSHIFELEFRPDLYATYKRLSLMLKPRLNLSYTLWGEGAPDSTEESDSEGFVNEWLAGYRPVDALNLSYGREALLWGPSTLLSPSNPFYRDNGSRNPKVEVPGSDFFRVVLLPNPSWTVSLIGNVAEGRKVVYGEFEPIYALKADYTGYRKYVSLVGSWQKSFIDTSIDIWKGGGYFGWTVTDALLLHAEANAFTKSDSLYPRSDPSSPYGTGMIPDDLDESSLDGTVLIGGSYTFEAGPTLLLEYLYNGPGYSAGEAELYYDLRRKAAEDFYAPQPAASLSRQTLSNTLDPGLFFLRKNYAMFQYQHVRIRNVLDMIFRVIYNIDDQSGQFIPIVLCDVGDWAQLYLIGAQNFGPRESEFRSIFDYSYTAGIEFSF